MVAANGRGFGNGSGGSSGGRGAQTINGLGMLVNQAALNFKIWTGVDAPMDVMKQTLMNEFGSFYPPPGARPLGERMEEVI